MPKTPPHPQQSDGQPARAHACARRGEGSAWRRGAATWSRPGAGTYPRLQQRQAGETKLRRSIQASARAHAADSEKMLYLSLLQWLLALGQAAPKDGATRAQAETRHDLQSNPFQSGPEQFRLLQNYLIGLEQASGNLEHMSREQVLLYLFALHDFDESSQLDGLELLAMLKAALFPGAEASSSTNQVIQVIDKVLETQDLNRDGLVSPAELLVLPGDTLRHQGPQESSVAIPGDLGFVDRSAMLATDPLEQTIREPMIPEGVLGPGGEDVRKAIDPGKEVRSPGEDTGPEEDGRKVTDSEQEARSLGEAIGGQEVEAGYQREASDITGPGGDVGEGVEAVVTEGEILEPGESLEPKELPDGFEGHVIQVENDEM
ncbi:cell growth regulator with EF hand domain protein 1 isoform X2 [Monodelphis domestica]|uniref:cell growth regulator with EF hand domain protein 1 isoform X2 n=1 Tax=Monodelphis domestica TaxID=13616 RepID=UPI0024E21D1D|nr:cell growth regulator with EF hand domain protein 1 isoform X2 [Monodelphis domestica]